MDAFEILVVALSVVLGILLVLSIVLVTVLIKLLNSIRDITKKAENIMDDVESVSDFFKNAAPKVAITTLVSNIVGKITEAKDRRK